MSSKNIKYETCLRLIISNILVILMLSFTPVILYGQEEDKVASKEKAGLLFNSGYFSESLKHYRELAGKFTKDPVYKYYSGACMVELQENIPEAIILLEESRKESSSLREVPHLSLFYLGRAYQIESDFESAIEYYDLFRDRIRKKEAKEYKLDNLIKECNDQKTKDQRIKDSKIKDRKIEDQENNEQAADDLEIEDQEADYQSIKNDSLEIVENVIYAGGDYDSIARQGMKFQFIADSLTRIASRYRKTIKSLGGIDRQSVNKKILDLESDIFRFQSLAEKKFVEAASFNRVLYDGESIDQKIEDQKIEDLKIEDSKMGEEKKEDQETEEQRVKNDSIEIAEIVIEELPEPVFTLFDPETQMKDIIPINDTLPKGLYYRIQTAAFRNPIKISYFKTLSPVYGIRAADSDITFYFIGMFRRKTDADLSVVKVRAAGFKDAFVVAIFDGNRISPERSEVLEKDWENTSLFDAETKVNEKKSDKALTLVFRVEADRSEKKFKEDKIETLMLVAGKREFEIVQNDDKNYICLIGKFLTFESARAYADLLFRNGLKDAKVAAYLGKREIPVETARDLFNLNNKE